MTDDFNFAYLMFGINKATKFIPNLKSQKIFGHEVVPFSFLEGFELRKITSRVWVGVLPLLERFKSKENLDLVY